jgi:hypothetical protein
MERADRCSEAIYMRHGVESAQIKPATWLCEKKIVARRTTADGRIQLAGNAAGKAVHSSTTRAGKISA